MNHTVDQSIVVVIAAVVEPVGKKKFFTNWHFQISYDVSQRLMKKTNVLELSNNPWKCTCSSEINDRVSGDNIFPIYFWKMNSLISFYFCFWFQNLLEKVTDKKNLTCGPSSDVDLAEKRVSLHSLLPYTLKVSLLTTGLIYLVLDV